MHDPAALLVLLVVIYLIECAWWLPNSAVVFQTSAWRRWRVGHPGTVFGNMHGGLVLATPWLPLGQLLVARSSRGSVSPTHVYAWTGQTWHPRERALMSAPCIALDDVKTVEVAGREVFVNGTRLLTADHDAAARQLAQWLNTLAQTPASRRADLIDQHIAQSLNAEQARERLQALDDHTQGLRWACNALALFIFAAAPALVWVTNFYQLWPALLGMLLALAATAWWLLARAHRALYPEARRERWKHLAMTAVSPLELIRAVDLLSIHTVEDLNPLAVAATVLDREDFATFAGRVLRDLHHPRAPVCPDTDDEAVATELWHRQRLRDAVERWLPQQGVDVRACLAPPGVEGHDCRSYCPRCQGQFADAAGSCEACGGLALRPLAAAGELSTQ